MKIVIDIPEKVYSYLKTEYDKVTPEVDTSIIYLMKSVIDGIVLPQEHGDLIDRDKLVYYRCPDDIKNCPSSYDFTCNSCEFGITRRFRVDGAEVIIPAEKGNT